MRSSSLVFIAAGVMGLVGPSLAGEIRPPKDWITAERFNEAVELAAKRNVGMAIVVSARSYSCPRHSGDMNSLLRASSLKGLLRVLLYRDEAQKPLRAMHLLRHPRRPIISGLYLLDPHMRLLAYMHSARHKQFPEMAALAKSVVAWQGQAASKLQGAERLAERGFYKRALKTVQQVADEDSKVTAKVLETAESVDSVIVVQTGDQGPTSSETSGEETQDDEEAEEPVEGKFFPDCVETYRQKFEAMARECLANAEKCYQNKNYHRARELLAAMVRDGSDLETIQDAKALLDKVEAAQRRQAEQQAEPSEDKTGDD